MKPSDKCKHRPAKSGTGAIYCETCGRTAPRGRVLDLLRECEHTDTDWMREMFKGFPGPWI